MRSLAYPFPALRLVAKIFIYHQQGIARYAALSSRATRARNVTSACSTTSISSGGVLSRPIADAQVRALAETLNQTTARAEKHEQTTGKPPPCSQSLPSPSSSRLLGTPASPCTADMLRHTLKDLRRELRDKSRRLEEAHSAMDVIRAESDALRHRASTDDATIRRLQARVDLLESLGRKDGTTGELRRLEHRLADTTVALEDAREAQRAAQALAATQAEQLKVTVGPARAHCMHATTMASRQRLAPEATPLGLTRSVALLRFACNCSLLISAP